MSSEPSHPGPEAAESPPDLKDADVYAYRLEMLGSLLLAVIGALVYKFLGGQFGEAVGANMFAAGAVALLVFFVYGRLLRSRRQRLSMEQAAMVKEIYASTARIEAGEKLEQERIEEAIAAGVPETLAPFHIAKQIGLTGFDPSRPVDVIEQAVLEAESTVDILEISLKTMREVEAADWLKCKARVRIILLDPLFPERQPLAVQRDEEERQNPGTILKEIHEVVRALPDEWLGSSNGESSSAKESRVKLARVMPTLSYFRIDGIAYFAPLVHKRLGDRTMHLQLRKGGQFFKELEDHFEKLWKDQDRAGLTNPQKVPARYPVPPHPV